MSCNHPQFAVTMPAKYGGPVLPCAHPGCKRSVPGDGMRLAVMLDASMGAALQFARDQDGDAWRWRFVDATPIDFEQIRRDHMARTVRYIMGD